MIVYVLIVSILIFAHILVNDKKQNDLLFFCIVGFIIILQGLRSFSVGVDLQSYELYFYQNSQINIIDIIKIYKTECLFHIMNRLIFLLGGNFRVVLFVTSIIIFVPLALIIKKYSKMPYISLLLFVLLGFFAFSLSGLRQTAAIGITIIAFIFIKKKKILPFIIFVFIATLFHNSAVIFFLAYPIYNFKLTKNNVVWLILFAIPIFIFRKQIVVNLGKLYNDYYEVVETKAYNFLLMLIAFFIASIIILIRNEKKETFGLINFLFASVVIQFFVGYSQVVMRFNYYYIIYLIFLIPELILNIERYSYRIAFSSFIIGFLGLQFFMQIKNNVMQIYPYTFLTKDLYWFLDFTSILVKRGVNT